MKLGHIVSLQLHNPGLHNESGTHNTYQAYQAYQAHSYTMKLRHVFLQLHNPGLHNENGMQCVPGLPVLHTETPN